jgi:integrase
VDIAVRWIISGALNRAKRWKLIVVSVADQAEPPPMPAAKPKPKPPSMGEAARILAEARSGSG